MVSFVQSLLQSTRIRFFIKNDRVQDLFGIGRFGTGFSPIYSGERDEPPHVHVERDRQMAKFWLTPVRLQESGGFKRVELRRIERLVEENEEDLLKAWNEFFSD